MNKCSRISMAPKPQKVLTWRYLHRRRKKRAAGNADGDAFKEVVTKEYLVMFAGKVVKLSIRISVLLPFKKIFPFSVQRSFTVYRSMNGLTE